MISLSFLPVGLVEPTFGILMNQLGVSGLLTQFPRLQDVYTYFRRVFIGFTDEFGRRRNARYPPDQWNQFDRVMSGLPRSDASLENFHKTSRPTLGTHLSLPRFVDRLKILQSSYEQQAYRLDRGAIVGRPRHAGYVQLDRELRNVVTTANRNGVFTEASDRRLMDYLDAVDCLFRSHGSDFPLDLTGVEGESEEDDA